GPTSSRTPARQRGRDDGADLGAEPGGREAAAERRDLIEKALPVRAVDDRALDPGDRVGLVEPGQVVARNDFSLSSAPVDEGETAGLEELRGRHAEMLVDHSLDREAAAAHATRELGAVEP